MMPAVQPAAQPAVQPAAQPAVQLAKPSLSPVFLLHRLWSNVEPAAQPAAQQATQRFGKPATCGFLSGGLPWFSPPVLLLEQEQNEQCSSKNGNCAREEH